MGSWRHAWRGMGVWRWLCALPFVGLIALFPDFYANGLPQRGCAFARPLGPWPVSYRVRDGQLLINPCDACLASLKTLTVDGVAARPAIHGALAVRRTAASTVEIVAERWDGRRFADRVPLAACREGDGQ